MKPYPLEDLLKIRDSREQTATNRLAVSRHRMEEAEIRLQGKRRDLERFRSWRIQRETGLFDAVKKAPISLNELEKLKQTVQQLRGREAQLDLEMRQTETAKNEAAAQWEKDREALRAICRDHRKIREHKAVWFKEMQHKRALAAELELEEFRAKPPAPEVLGV